MKRNSILFAGLLTVLSTVFVACSQDDGMQQPDIQAEQENVTQNYVYNLHMDCMVPEYDDVATRASSWANGSVVHLIFKNGVKGTATYQNGSWTVKADNSLGTVTTQTTCQAVYIENPVSAGTMSMNYKSALYLGTGTYTCSTSDIYVTVTLSPSAWRLRFKGAAGTKIRLPKNNNDIVYYNTLEISSSGTITTKSNSEDISLVVNSNGYTDYVYGNLVNKEGNNTIYLINETEGKNYYRNKLTSSHLSAGQSGYLTIPTASTASSLEWSEDVSDPIDANAYVKPDFMATFTYGMATNWTVGSTAFEVYFCVFKSLDDYANDDEIIAEVLEDNTAKDAQKYATTITSFSGNWYSEDTNYYLCTIAYNSKGERGELQKIPFTTKSSTLPTALVSNIEAVTGPKWAFDVTLKNGASKYYLYSTEDVEDYNSDEIWIGYYMYRWINSKQLTNLYDYEGVSCNRSDNQIVIGTVAVDAKGNIGNYSCSKASASSYATYASTVQRENAVESDKFVSEETREFDEEMFENVGKHIFVVE